MRTVKTFHTHSPEETQAVGVEIGQRLRPGDVVALSGDLGAGKTCLTQGIARGVGLAPGEIVNSPSYILMNQYAGRIPIYHIDLYRLQDPNQIADLGLEEFLEGDGVCVIEWAERMQAALPAKTIFITITEEGESIRRIDVSIEAAMSNEP